MADREGTTATATAPPDIALHEPVIESSRAKRMYFIVGAAVVLLVILYAIWVLVTSGKESTDDAQVAADVVPIAARISGQIAHVYIHENEPVKAGQVLADIDPQDAAVKVAQMQGDVATAQAQAVQAEARATVTEAGARGALTTAQATVRSSRETVDSSANAITAERAALARADANAQKARNDWTRASELGAKGDISRSQVDTARAANEAAQADLAAARARVQQ